jgi:hypothetical protein
MASAKDELWSLSQRSRGLAGFLSELRLMWNDSAAQFVSSRYLNPQQEDDARMQQALREQEESLAQAQEHAGAIDELAVEAEKLTQRIEKVLSETGQEVRTAYGHHQTFSEFNNTAHNQFPVVLQFISRANSACGQPDSENQSAALSGGNSDSIFSTSPKIGIEHLFHGEINEHNRAVGFHHRGSIGHEGKARVTKITREVNQYGVYAAKVEIFNPSENRWVPKSRRSTFFPDNWSRQKVLDEIRVAYSSAKLSSDGSRYWEGTCSAGFRIGGYLNEDGTIRTAYPIMP